MGRPEPADVMRRSMLPIIDELNRDKEADKR
jgi:hypothetical protein